MYVYTQVMILLKFIEFKLLTSPDMRPDWDGCMGNGFRRIWSDQHEKEKITIQCAVCESAGEVEDEDFSYDYSGLDLNKLQ